MNKDDAELSKFNSLARDFWDPNGPMKPLHQINPLRIDWIEQHTDRGLEGLRALDIGCGGGLVSEALTRRGAQVTGLDSADKLLKTAQIHATDQDLNIDYQLGLAEDYCTANAAQFDLVTCLEMLEHVPDPASIVSAIEQALKPGGVAILSTLNRTAKGFALGIVAAEYLLKWVEPGTHHYRKFIKPSELTRFCRDAGLVLTDMTGLRYNPLYQAFELAPQDVDVNYFICVRKPHVS